MKPSNAAYQFSPFQIIIKWIVFISRLRFKVSISNDVHDINVSTFLIKLRYKYVPAFGHRDLLGEHEELWEL